jgi:hypothetical protein
MTKYLAEDTRGTCATTGKVRHATRASAKSHLRRLRRAKGKATRATQPIGVYACPDCGCWHVGHLTREALVAYLREQRIQRQQVFEPPP